MFTDESLPPHSVRPRWKKSRESERESKGCQTQRVHSAEAVNQSVTTADCSAQTDTQDHEMQLFQKNDDNLWPPGLKDFLLRVEALVISELVVNARSHAFDGFHVNWEEQKTMVSCLHRLQHLSVQERHLGVTSMSWSCTGAVIACAYGRIADGDWSTEKSYVCLWNLECRGLNPKQADVVIDVPSAVSALCCHPQRPALIAGGLYSGEVLVWDTSRTQDLVLAQTGMSADSHKEPIYQIAWVPLQKKGEFGVLSASSGGKVLLWTVDSSQGMLILTSAYTLVRQQLPHSSSLSFMARVSSSVGVTSLALSPWDSDTFIAGSEGGQLFRCSFSTKTLAAVASEGQSVTPRAPVVFSFRPGSGPVHTIDFSPFHRNLFLSAGTDGLVHLHSLLQANPMLSLRVSDSYIFQVQWSPTRPLIFAAATGQGDVQIVDLGSTSRRPAATINHGGAGQAATCLAFNTQNPRLLAVGKTDGTVGIWQLSTNLTEQMLSETSQLEQIASQVIH